MARSAAAQRWLIRDFGTCLSIPGSSKVTATNNATLNPTTFTIAAWIYQAANTSADFDRIAEKKSTNAGWLWLFDNTAGHRQVYFAIYNTANAEHDSLKYSAPFKYWTHYAYTFDGSNLRAYINSVLYSTTAFVGSYAASSNKLSIGAGDNGLNAGVFTIDEFLILPTVLDQTGITLLYNTSSHFATPSVKYLFNEGSGSSATDASGNGNTGTIVTATYTTNTLTTLQNLH